MTNAVQPDWQAQPDWRSQPDWQAQPDWRAQPDGAARPDERQAHYVPVRCRECDATVLAAKFSVQHTSVQWDAAAVGECAEFAARRAVGEQTPLIERCSAMRASIETAAREGRLPVAPP
jgi:hypothetical protein